MTRRRRSGPRRGPLRLLAAGLAVGAGTGAALPLLASTAGLTGVPSISLQQQAYAPPTYSIVEAASPPPPRGGTVGTQYTGMYVTVSPTTPTGPTRREAGDVRVRVTTGGTTTGHYACTLQSPGLYLCSYGTPLGSSLDRPVYASGVAAP